MVTFYDPPPLSHKRAHLVRVMDVRTQYVYLSKVETGAWRPTKHLDFVDLARLLLRSERSERSSTLK